MAVTRAEIESVLASVLPLVPAATVRLVGTASSALRGIELPANDIDILFQDRAGVDAWFNVLTADLEVEQTPTWIADSQQYFARLRAAHVVIELSTVEIQSDADTFECFGRGPWRYVDLVDCGACALPTVSTELRLITEVSRGRTDRYGPILDHLRGVTRDVALIQRGLMEAGVTSETVAHIVPELSPGDHQ